MLSIRQNLPVLIAILLLFSAACGGAPPVEAPASPTPPPPEATEPPEPTDAPEPTATATSPPPDRPILFTSNRGDNPGAFNIYSIDPESGEIVQITTGFGFAAHPVWSPDSEWIVFSTNDTGAWRIHTIRPDGSELTQVTDFSSAIPDWFPSGDRLVFNSDHQTEPVDVPDLYAMNLDGSDLVQIIDQDATADFDGQISPDGSKLLFTSDRTGNFDLFVVNVDGSGLTQLTDGPETDHVARWSPDGSQILFVSFRGGNEDIWVMNADGSNPVQLTFEPGTDSQSAWSPDGSQIVFVSDRGGNVDLWMMNADGSNPVQLTDEATLNIFPDW